MPKYQVRICLTQTRTWIVDADNEKKAIEAAKSRAHAYYLGRDIAFLQKTDKLTPRYVEKLTTKG